MSQLVIWNDNKYANTLASFYGSENVVTSYNSFISLLDKWNKFTSIIVLCELEWSHNGLFLPMQNLGGIDLVKDIRRVQNVNIPVLFVSFMSLKRIYNSEREILTTIGHCFLRLPLLPENLKSFIETDFKMRDSGRKLSVMEMNDIKSFYCSKEGILSHKLHYLNKFLNLEIDPINHPVIYDELCETIKSIHELFFLEFTSAINSFYELFPTINKSNISLAVNHIIRMGNALHDKYGIRVERVNELLPSQDFYPWRVLFLDDEINENHELISCMKKNGLNPICVSRAIDAIFELKNDWETTNNIMIVVADYRLYELNDGIKKHQEIQGYEFLKLISSSDHLVRLVAFSGLQRKFLLNSFKHYSIRTEVKSKIDYLSDDHTYQLFCDELISIGEENWEAVEALPSKCAGFAKYLEDAYKLLRSNTDYNKMENIISSKATEQVREIQRQLGNNQDIRIVPIENIKSPLMKTIKDREAFFKRLQNYLIARRIALWLFASQKKDILTNIDSRRIAEILTDQKYTTDAYRQILSTNLGLSLDDFPMNITIEERRWLQYDMDMNIFRDIDKINFSFQKIQKYFSDFIKTNTSLSNLISKNNYTLSHLYKKNNYKITFDKNFAPLLKTSTDIRVMYLLMETQLLKETHGDKTSRIGE